MPYTQHIGNEVFISIEGMECTGKTGALVELEACLKELSVEAVFTREPGGTPIAERLREVLLSSANEMSAKEETMLLYTGRLHHLTTLIKPALQRGACVISDRYIDSTRAYQVSKGLSISDLTAIQNAALYECTDQGCGVMVPNLTVFFDLPIDEMMVRKNVRNTKFSVEDDAFEQRKVEFFETVRLNYLKASQEDRRNTIVLDGMHSEERVRSAFLDIVITYILNRTQTLEDFHTLSADTMRLMLSPMEVRSLIKELEGKQDADKRECFEADAVTG